MVERGAAPNQRRPMRAIDADHLKFAGRLSNDGVIEATTYPCICQMRLEVGLTSEKVPPPTGRLMF
ncbi:MAG: hypothetical protein VX589_17945 [Myxococcota bacterium]|nr:hypothetical protein [Myxococcota bacterium]